MVVKPKRRKMVQRRQSLQRASTAQPRATGCLAHRTRSDGWPVKYRHNCLWQTAKGLSDRFAMEQAVENVEVDLGPWHRGQMASVNSSFCHFPSAPTTDDLVADRARRSRNCAPSIPEQRFRKAGGAKSRSRRAGETGSDARRDRLNQFRVPGFGNSACRQRTGKSRSNSRGHETQLRY